MYIYVPFPAPGIFKKFIAKTNQKNTKLGSDNKRGVICKYNIYELLELIINLIIRNSYVTTTNKLRIIFVVQWREIFTYGL